MFAENLTVHSKHDAFLIRNSLRVSTLAMSPVLRKSIWSLGQNEISRFIGIF